MAVACLCGLIAAPGAGAREHAAPAAPAIVRGVGDTLVSEGLGAPGKRDAVSRWVLVGRLLRIEFGGELDPVHPQARVPVLVSCGDDALVGGGLPAVFAESVNARLRLPATADGAQVHFDRDIASRVDTCELTPHPGDPNGTITTVAQMKLRRGHRPGCVPGDREHIVARDPLAIVTYIPSAAEPDGSGLANAHRVCLLQDGRFTTVSTGSSDFEDVEIQRDFTLSGRWLAWLDQESAEAVSYPQIELLDLAQSSVAAPRGPGVRRRLR